MAEAHGEIFEWQKGSRMAGRKCLQCSKVFEVQRVSTAHSDRMFLMLFDAHLVHTGQDATFEYDVTIQQHTEARRDIIQVHSIKIDVCGLAGEFIHCMAGNA
jgi:hypothetical protein